MTASLIRRLEALEQCQEGVKGMLPMVVPDSISDAELERLRRAGVDAYRVSDDAIVDAFI